MTEQARQPGYPTATKVPGPSYVETLETENRRLRELTHTVPLCKHVLFVKGEANRVCLKEVKGDGTHKDGNPNHIYEGVVCPHCKQAID